jgi:hypothetical protein
VVQLPLALDATKQIWAEFAGLAPLEVRAELDLDYRKVGHGFTS